MNLKDVLSNIFQKVNNNNQKNNRKGEIPDHMEIFAHIAN